jgi:hypothetical protein
LIDNHSEEDYNAGLLGDSRRDNQLTKVYAGHNSEEGIVIPPALLDEVATWSVT